MNIIKNYFVGKDNINIGVEPKSNEAIIVGNHYIMNQLSKKGVTFDQMYPGIFIVTSLNGNPTIQDIEKINRLIKLYNPDLINEGNLVSKMSKEKMDAFFQNYFWTENQKKKMIFKNLEYRGDKFDIEQGSLIITYQEGKKGKEYTYIFGDGRTQLLGYVENGMRIEDVWDRYLFDETVKPWLEKNKLRISLQANNSKETLSNEKRTNTVETIELKEER